MPVAVLPIGLAPRSEGTIRMTRASAKLALGVLALALWCGPLAAEEGVETGAPAIEVSEEAGEVDSIDDSDPLLYEDELDADLYAEFDAEFDDEMDDGTDADPWEGMNRGIFAFNEFLDAWLFDPITDAYQFIFPEMFREGVNNVFLNLQSPVVIVNHLLQFRGKEALGAAGRFVINSTAGGGGFFDAAGRGANIKRVDADFGQTLAAWGTPPGPYLMLPILGPSTLRDATGDLVDRGMDPLTWMIGPVQWWIPIGLSQGLATRDANIEELNMLKESSLDFYSALRSAYLQSREAAVREALGQTLSESAAAN
jgi:phospholipid-binding lipoprotein MlaA